MNGALLSNYLLPFVGVVNALERNILLVVKVAIELGVVAVISELGVQKVDIVADQGAVASSVVLRGRASTLIQPVSFLECFLQSLVNVTCSMKVQERKRVIPFCEHKIKLQDNYKSHKN